MKIIITRPEPDAKMLRLQLEAKGIETCLSPVMRIEQTNTQITEDRLGALAFTSANGVRAYLARNPQNLQLPVFAVGAETARFCREAGFSNVHEADGNVENLAETIAEAYSTGTVEGCIAHIAGKDRAGDLQQLLFGHGVKILRFVLYHAVPSSQLQPDVIATLRGNREVGIVFYSPRTVTLFFALVAQVEPEIDFSMHKAFCLSKNVAKAAGIAGMTNIETAQAYTSAAVVEKIIASLPKK